MTSSILMVLLITLPLPADAQQVFEVRGSPSCESCEIALEPAVRLGALSDPVGFDHLGDTYLAVNSRGMYAVVCPEVLPGEIALYGPDGAFQRLIGREGGGPREFGPHLRVAFDALDSLHVVHLNGRYTVLAPEFEFVRTARLAQPPRGFALGPSGRIFANAGGGTYTLQLLTAEGSSVVSFDTREAVEIESRLPSQRWLAVGPDGSLWSVPQFNLSRYEVRMWNGEGRLERRYIAERDWLLDEWPKRGDRTPAPPPALVYGLDVDDHNRIWIWSLVPDPEWSPPRAEGGATPPPEDRSDTLIEVIDSETGALLARSRLDDLLRPIQGGGAYSMIETPEGGPRVQIWRTGFDGY